MSQRIRLRPFCEYLGRERHLPMLEVAGKIVGKRFIVAALGFEIELDTIEVGEDERGPYAQINECERSLPNGFKVRLEEEPDEHLPTGSALDIFLEGEARETVRAQLEAQGIEPDSVTLLTPHERHFSVYFDSIGLVNGRGSSYVDDGKRPVTN